MHSELVQQITRLEQQKIDIRAANYQGMRCQYNHIGNELIHVINSKLRELWELRIAEKTSCSTRAPLISAPDRDYKALRYSKR